ncbi:MAG: DUF4384 domain-containing protein [Gemmatimonadales bacterium]|nr:MAG: DUF4384 domain-containing protein [Gemmatimonadales bacterium]
MNRIWGWIAVLAVAWSAPSGVLEAQPFDEPSVEARIWLDRGDEPVVDRGDRVRVYYRTSADGYLAIFHIDTNGAVSLLFPASPEADHWVRGGQDYRLLFPRSSYWFVDEDPGIGYFFILASPTPLDFRDFRYSWAGDGWDLSFVGRTVHDDPFVAMDEYIARLIPEWEYADYALDWVEYNVGDQHDYPRFLCYDCHGFSPYSAWNPYLSACTSFQVVIYNDPWYYPVNRYRGTRVVYVRPPVWRQPRFVFKERGVGEPWSPSVRPRPSDGGRPGIPGSAAPRRSGAGIGSGGSVPPVSRPRSTTPGAVRLEPRTRPTRGRPVFTPRTGEDGSARTTPGTRGGTPAIRTPSTGVRSTRPSTSGVRGMPATRPGGSTGSRTTPAGRPAAGSVRTPETRSGDRATSTGSIPVILGRPSNRSTPSSRTPSTSGARTPSRTIPSTARSGGSTRSIPSTTRSRAPTRSVPSTTRSRTPTRSLPSATRSRTPNRSSGTARRSAPVRSSAGSSRTPPRSSAGSSRPPTRTAPARRPPVRRKPGGGSVP